MAFTIEQKLDLQPGECRVIGYIQHPNGKILFNELEPAIFSDVATQAEQILAEALRLNAEGCHALILVSYVDELLTKTMALYPYQAWHDGGYIQ